MRVLAASFLIVWCAGCHCSPSNPSPVTLRLKNTSNDAIFVDDTDAKLGLTVQRNVNGTWFGFGEAPCICNTCDRTCDTSCTCDAGSTNFVRRVLPGETLERTWDGVVQVAAVASCPNFGGGNATCVHAENAPLDEDFQLELCYQLQVPGVDLPDGGRIAATFPAAAQSCTDKVFRVIDGVVEVSPPKGSTCATSSDCKGMGELCFAGSCTANCPDNGFPVLGAGWALRVAQPDDQGFFTTTMEGTHTVTSGTGTVSSVLYNGGTMTARLKRLGSSGETLTGAIYLTLPAGNAAPLPQGATVTVRVIDGSTTENPENRAMVIRSADGGLLLAADQAQQGVLLQPADLAPFTVTFALPIIGCRLTECGKQLFFQTEFSAAPADTLLDPGKSALLTTAQGAYQALNVSSAGYGSTDCKVYDIRPFALWRQGP